MNTIEERFTGALYGSLAGDALGVPVEFAARNVRDQDPVTGMRAHGTHNQLAGTWSDDGALLLCSAESLVEKSFDSQDMGERFVRWRDESLWTARGRVFDIGIATQDSLSRIAHGTPAEQAGGTQERDNGNGSLMRILPVALASFRESDQVFCDRIERSSAITHGHARSRMACVFHGFVVRQLLAGFSPAEALRVAGSEFSERYAGNPEIGVFDLLLTGELGQLPRSEILSTGYVIDTLTASLWCLLTENDFSACVLKAVNLGGDTDTTGCVAGGLAGVLWGIDAIPRGWVDELPRQEDLRALTGRFVSFAS